MIYEKYLNIPMKINMIPLHFQLMKRTRQTRLLNKWMKMKQKKKLNCNNSMSKKLRKWESKWKNRCNRKILKLMIMNLIPHKRNLINHLKAQKNLHLLKRKLNLIPKLNLAQIKVLLQRNDLIPQAKKKIHHNQRKFNLRRKLLLKRELKGRKENRDQ